MVSATFCWSLRVLDGGCACSPGAALSRKTRAMAGIAFAKGLFIFGTSLAEEDISVIGRGRLAGIVRVGHEGHAGNRRRIFAEEFFIIFQHISLFLDPL